MVLMQFVPWLRRQHRRDDPIGDLARDVRADRVHTGRMQTYRGLWQYLEPHACEKALKALERAHAEYRSQGGS